MHSTPTQKGYRLHRSSGYGPLLDLLAPQWKEEYGLTQWERSLLIPTSTSYLSLLQESARARPLTWDWKLSTSLARNTSPPSTSPPTLSQRQVLLTQSLLQSKHASWLTEQEDC